MGGSRGKLYHDEENSPGPEPQKLDEYARKEIGPSLPRPGHRHPHPIASDSRAPASHAVETVKPAVETSERREIARWPVTRNAALKAD